MQKMECHLLIAMIWTGSVCAQSDIKPFETERIIVKYRTDGMSQIGVASLVGMLSTGFGTDIEYIRPMSGGAHVLRVKNKTQMSVNNLSLLNQQLGFEYIVPDRIMQPVMVPNDNLYNQQWDFFETLGGINVPAAWDMTIGNGIRVGVIDTGYRPHVDLKDNILPGYDFIRDAVIGNDGDGRDADAQDPGDWLIAGACGNGYPPTDRSSSWHGTHVSGTIAAKINNELGVAGIASDSKIVPVRVLGKCGGYTSDILDGMRWAAGIRVPGIADNPNPVRVMNLSLGGAGPCDAAYESAIQDIKAQGGIVVVAAGNSEEDAENFTPASCADAITVASTDRTGGRAWYSNYGEVVDISAPGGDTRTGPANGILSTLNAGKEGPGEDSYGAYQGTSMASPHIAGVVALMLSANPKLTPDAVEGLLKQSARVFPDSGVILCTVDNCGAGIADATEAVKAAVVGTVIPTPIGALENRVPKTSLSASRKRWLRYTFEITAPDLKKLSIEMRDGTGDADVFVKHRTPSSRTQYDRKSEMVGNQDKVEFANPQPGIYHIGIYAYAAFQGLTIVAVAE